MKWSAAINSAFARSSMSSEDITVKIRSVWWWHAPSSPRRVERVRVKTARDSSTTSIVQLPRPGQAKVMSRNCNRPCINCCQPTQPFGQCATVRWFRGYEDEIVLWVLVHWDYVRGRAEVNHLLLAWEGRCQVWVGVVQVRAFCTAACGSNARRR